jgi:prepilin-type N-terminal cleavage/methylation domain-containing protein
LERSRSNIGATAPQCAGGRRAPVAKRRAFGFTLVEAMVVVAVLAIIAAMAMPSFSSFVGKSGSLGIESDFVNAMSFARSEAMRRGVPVAVTAAASAAGNAFGQGWTVWVDSNANGTYDSGEPVLRQHAAYPAGISLGDGTVTQVYFNQQGYLTGGPYQFKACSASAAGPTGYQITALSGGVFDVRESVTCP